jgi:hypothetical protein
MSSLLQIHLGSMRVLCDLKSNFKTLYGFSFELHNTQQFYISDCSAIDISLISKMKGQWDRDRTQCAAKILNFDRKFEFEMIYLDGCFGSNNVTNYVTTASFSAASSLPKQKRKKIQVFHFLY